MSRSLVYQIVINGNTESQEHFVETLKEANTTMKTLAKINPDRTTFDLVKHVNSITTLRSYVVDKRATGGFIELSDTVETAESANTETQTA